MKNPAQWPGCLVGNWLGLIWGEGFNQFSEEHYLGAYLDSLLVRQVLLEIPALLDKLLFQKRQSSERVTTAR